MPRTKRPVKRAVSTGEGSTFNKNLDKLLEQQKKKIDLWAERESKSLKIAFTIFMSSVKAEHLNMSIGQMRNELYFRETTTDTKSDSRSDRRPASHDDGYMTANSSQGSGERGARKIKAASSASSRSVVRRSRSADASSRKLQASRTTQRRRSRSMQRTPAMYRTPALNKNNHPSAYPPITPKVAPHAPLTVLRQPRLGEMVVSLTGSPVMVPTYSNMSQEEKATCNIMLNDGTLLSLQPRELRPSQAFIPYSLMAPEALEQMRTIKENLDMVLRRAPK